MIDRLPLRTVVALGAATALIVAGCGGDDDSADTTNAATTVADTNPATIPATTSATTEAPIDVAPTTISGGDSLAPDGDDIITIANFAFGGVAEVTVGTTVTITNTDSAPHTWSADDGTFDSGAIAPGESFAFTFTEPGIFAYFCNFHPSMTGTIAVTG